MALARALFKVYVGHRKTDGMPGMAGPGFVGGLLRERIERLLRLAEAMEAQTKCPCVPTRREVRGRLDAV